MTSGLSFWGPFLVIFGAAIVLSVVQRYARDICLMRLHGQHVIIQLRSGRWIWGLLDVHSKALEIVYCEPRAMASGHEYLTHVLYEQNIAEITLMLRPEPSPGSADYSRWVREMHKLRNPGIWARRRRDLRKLFNMLRNAFSESIAVLVGIVKQRTAVGRIAGADIKATDTGQKLLTAIPANFEPILEHYRGQDVAVETFMDVANPSLGILTRIGVLDEYSDKFLLIRDVVTAADFPPAALRPDDAPDRFAVLVPRTTSFVRHLARRADTAISPEEILKRVENDT